MAQTALPATADDATVAQLLAFTEEEPTMGINLYTDTGNAASGNGVAAATLHDYQRVRIRSGSTPVFNNTDLTDAHIAARVAAGTIFYVKKIANRANKQQLLFQIAGGTYNNDYLRWEDIEYIS